MAVVVSEDVVVVDAGGATVVDSDGAPWMGCVDETLGLVSLAAGVEAAIEELEATGGLAVVEVVVVVDVMSGLLIWAGE